VDISGRPYLVFNVPLQRTRIGGFDLDLLQDFFRAFAFNAEITLHVTMHYGENLHHIAEAVFKSVGRALAEATRLNPRIADVLSTKGTL
jgi:imidazoleglycerol-phosphate dehydratase